MRDAPSAFAHERVVVQDSPKALTASVYGPSNTVPALRAALTLEGGPIRWRVDGGNPTTELGHLMSAGDVVIVERNRNIFNYRAIRVTGTDGVLQATYEH